MSDIDQKREAVKKVYSRENWDVAKVDKMPDSQVIAIYLRFQREQKL